MITFFIILGIFIGLWVAFHHLMEGSELSILPAIYIVVFGSIVYFFVKSDNETKRCLETVQPIIPRIVHLEDSSKKILKYYYEGIDREIEINRTSNNFYLPESLLKIEPCNRTIFIQR